MNDRWLKPVVLAGLFAAFGMISVLVIVTRRHPFFVHKKLRLGALLLSITGASVGCRGVVSCYVAPAPELEDEVVLYGVPEGTWTVSLDVAETDSLSGYLTAEYVRRAYSFAVLDTTSDSVLTKGDLRPTDGAFDGLHETFSLQLPSVPPIGVYDLRFYDSAMDSVQDFTSCIVNYRLHIVDSRS